MSHQEYESEARMCEDITAQARQAGFTVYPEQNGWDLLLVRAGIQIGVQAKLKFTHHLVAQALDGVPWTERGRRVQVGPHYRAVACQPSKSVRRDAQVICKACHLLFLDLNNTPEYWLYRHPHNRRGRYVWGRRTPVSWRYYRWHPNKLEWLPPGVPDLPAGVPSPSVVGPWQVAACKLEKLCLERGWITRYHVSLILQDVGAQFNPSTLLSRYYECTTATDPNNPKRRLWRAHPRYQPASRQFPAAWKMVNA